MENFNLKQYLKESKLLKENEDSSPLDYNKLKQILLLACKNPPRRS